jgi:DNA end-binding protein Ku
VECNTGLLIASLVFAASAISAIYFAVARPMREVVANAEPAKNNLFMRAIWKGAISFGLVSIPISLYPATRREELKFRLLRAKDLSPVNYKRVAETDGKEVPWDQIVKGYEYEKGKFVVIKDEDFARVDVEATQTVDILNVVKLEEINPLLFSKPYFMQVERGGEKAYALLRESLEAAGKVGISKVVIKERQHLAAIKPQHHGLMLELMRFPDEVVDADEFKPPTTRASSAAERRMATQLIESMSVKWNPAAYHDDYREALQALIDKKIEKGGENLPAPRKARKTTQAIDLVSVLQQSIQAAKRGAMKPLTTTKRRGGMTHHVAHRIR